MNLFFIYYSADLTAKMTSQPYAAPIESFQDVEDQVRAKMAQYLIPGSVIRPEKVKPGRGAK